eukprot:5522711-Pleurochrysis_carterae.AAC.1
MSVSADAGCALSARARVYVCLFDCACSTANASMSGEFACAASEFEPTLRHNYVRPCSCQTARTQVISIEQPTVVNQVCELQQRWSGRG